MAKKSIVVTGYAFVFHVLLMAGFLHSCMTFRSSPAKINAYFAKENLTVYQESYRVGPREIHYVKAGNPGGPLVLFVHGSPGSLTAFLHFLKDTTLLQKALLVTTDRPGFGYSNFGWAEPSLEKQAALLKPLLEKFRNNHPVILVGHSLGGPVIARMAMDFPALVDGLLLVAASIDPELEPNETWFRAPLATPFLSWVLPRSIRTSNEEIYHAKPELRRMLPHWEKIACPVIVIQGGKDALVPPGNAEFARKVLTRAPTQFVLVENMNHFVPWSNPELITQSILSLLQTTATPISAH